MLKLLVWCLTLSLLFSLHHSVFAQSADTVATQGASQTVDYSLPYPGLLPDNPLYPLKALRDTIVGALISQPVKKAEFYQLEADKHLAAAILLAQMPGKASLIQTTLAKGENYAEGCLKQIVLAKKQGYNSDAELHSLDTALKKHNAVVSDMLHHAKAKDTPGFEQLRSQIHSLQKSVAAEIAKEKK